MSWRAGFCVTYRGVPLRFAFAFTRGLWWALDDLCVLFHISEPATVILLDIEPDDKAELEPYHTPVVNSAALYPWVETAELNQFHDWIRHWLFPLLGEAFTSNVRDQAEAMAILRQRGVTAWSVEDV